MNNLFPTQTSHPATPSEVLQYYLAHLNTLSDYTRFHFLTRIFFISKDPLARDLLQQYYLTNFQQQSPAQQFHSFGTILSNPKLPDAATWRETPTSSKNSALRKSIGQSKREFHC